MKLVQHTIRAILGCAAGLATLQAHAAEEIEVLEEVQVTGSRIVSDGMSTPTPVTALTMDELQALAPGTLGAALTQLPQFNSSSSPEAAPAGGWTGSGGATFLNLRGVGSNRTLVLLDGRRVVPSTRRGTLDINLIPDALVQRSEVVTGGASAAYGSDAVSGVVNFILDTRYRGMQAEVQGGVTERGDNQNVGVNLAGGTAWGSRAHIIAAVDYYTAKPIKDARALNWWNSAGAITNPEYNAVTNPGVPQRITRENVRTRQYTEGGLILNGPLAFQQFQPDGTLAPFVAGTDVSANTQVGGSGLDPAWYNYLTPEVERGSAYANLSFDLTDSVQLFVQGLHGRNDAAYLSPPAGAQFGSWAYTIYGDNAYLPASIASTMTSAQSFRLGRSGDLDYGAGKEIEQRNRLLSGTAGLSARLGDGWRADAYFQYGRTHSNVYMDNAIRLDRIYQAVDAVRDADGNTVCRSTLMYPTDGCVPMNVFGVGAPSPEAVNWVTADISQKQLVDQRVAEATLSGTPFRNWAGEVGFATGVSWRREAFRQDVYPVDLHQGTDVPQISPALGYKGLPTVYAGTANIFERGPSATPRGNYSVREAFIETQVPLLGETAISRSMAVNGAVRLADYSGSGTVWAWKVGLDWALNDSLRLRGTRSRDVRAGSLSERFDTSRGPGTVDDPTDDTPTPYVISVISGGNPEVNPERADTLTFGFVLRPERINGLSLSVDAYDIDIGGAIGQLGAQEIVDQCFEGATGLCGYVDRDEAGAISVVRNLFVNTDRTSTRGIDIETIYTRPITLFGGNERLRLRALAAYIDRLTTQVAGGTEVDRAGQTGLGGGSPDWQGTVSVGYSNGPFSGTLTGRYLAAGLYNSTWQTGVEIDDNTVDPFFISNLQLNYDGQLRNGADYGVWLNVSNLFDAEPPRVASFAFTGSSATNSSLFDIYGRRFTLGMKVRF